MAVSTVTWDLVRDLAEFRAEEVRALSLYVDLDASVSPTPAALATRLRSLLGEAEREAGEAALERAERSSFEVDLARIREWWDSEFERDGAQGLAVFAASADGFFRTLPLARPVADRVALAPDLCVSPLLPLVGQDDGALVAFLGRERGQVYRLTSGRLVEVVNESEEQPGQHTQGGWSQARYQRHIEKLVQEHLRAVGAKLDRRVRRARPELVMVAPPELRAEIESALSTETREAIVGWAHAEAHASPEELLELARPLLDHARALREQESYERWREELGRGGLAAAGWPQTLEAVSDARVDELLVDVGRGRSAYQCPDCGRAEASAGACPLDGATLALRPDGVDLAVHQVLAGGGTILTLAPELLADHQGIGALLRF